MSDVSGGPGWWQASDGKWYPPESMPAPPPPGAYPPPGSYPAEALPPRSNSNVVVIALAAIFCLAVPLVAVVCIFAVTFLGRSASSQFSVVSTDYGDPSIVVPLDLEPVSGPIGDSARPQTWP